MNKFRRRSSSPLFFGERGGARVTSMCPGTCVECRQCPPPGVTQNSVDVTHYTHCRHRSVRTTFLAVANQALSAGARRPGEEKSTRPPAERRAKTVLFFPRWPQEKKRPRENLLATAAPALTAPVTGTAPSVERGMRRSVWLTASPTRREPGSAGTRRTVPTTAVLCAFLKLAPLCRQPEDTSEDGAVVDRLLSSSRVMCIRPDMSPCPIGPAMVRPHWPSMVSRQGPLIRPQCVLGRPDAAMGRRATAARLLWNRSCRPSLLGTTFVIEQPSSVSLWWPFRCVIERVHETRPVLIFSFFPQCRYPCSFSFPPYRFPIDFAGWASYPCDQAVV